MVYSKEKQTRRNYKVYDKADKGPESALQKQTEELLTWYKVPFWRMPDYIAGWIMKNAPDEIRFGFSHYFLGKPDITALFPNDRFLNFELKSEKGKLTTGQKRFANKAAVHVVKSIYTIQELIEKELDR